MSYDDGHYDVALICRNGHVANSMARDYPSSNSPFCPSCGEPTLSECPACKTDIRGHHHVPGVLGLAGYTVPSFCHQCGKPFPWTEGALAAAAELIETLETISTEEKATLEGTLQDLVRNTPRTKVAEARYRAIIKKVGKEAADALRSILVDVASDAVRKSLFGP